MYIKGIVLDGFKSYAKRTEVNGFDPLFNAITGLNGSGKSNILDSICFLLGITNLTHVRFYIENISINLVIHKISTKNIQPTFLSILVAGLSCSLVIGPWKTCIRYRNEYLLLT